jgi:hypothetical protein
LSFIIEKFCLLIGYSLFHRFGLVMWDDYFSVSHFLIKPCLFFEVAVAIFKIGLSQNLNNHKQI